MSPRILPVDEMTAMLSGALPELPQLLDAADGARLHLVGGAVRDLMLGRGRTDLDIAVEGDAREVARRLGGEVTEHERFATAKVRLGGAEIDLATSRAETYATPGALPDVRPAPIEEDLERRDFTVNAMALPLGVEHGGLLDPFGGREDLAEGVLRVLHDRSFVDDPTRAIRGARYAARFGLEPEWRTASLLAGADLDTVSSDRRRAEMLRLAAEGEAPGAIDLLSKWGVLEVPDGASHLAQKVAELMAGHPWSAIADRDHAVLAVIEGELGRGPELAEGQPERPSEGVEIARGATQSDLVIGRALGGAWLDDYAGTWMSVELEVRGEDLMAAGVPEGPAVGEGLAAALRRKLDGEIDGRDEELAAALEAARA